LVIFTVMLKVEYFGHSCFKVRGKHVSVFIDPFLEDSTGLELPTRKGDLVLVTAEKPEFNNVSAVQDYSYIVSGPGEYEVEDVQVFGFSVNGVALYEFKIDDVVFLHLGGLEKPLEEDVLSELGQVGVLFVPVGGVDMLGPEKAAEVVAQIEPGIVIPMAYQLDTDELSDLAPVSRFIEEMGEEEERKGELKLRSGSKLSEETDVIVLEVQ